MKTRKGSLFIIAAGICWGMIGLFSAKLSDAGCSAVEITFLRSAVTAVCLWAYLFWKDREKLKIRGKDIWMFLGTGMLSIVMFNIFYFITIELTTLSVAAILLYTAPCFVLLLSVFLFGEKFTAKKAAALVLALAGCACTTGLFDGGGAGKISLTGILTGIGSGFGYALYTIFGNIALKKYHTMTVTAYTFLISSVVLLPFGIAGTAPLLMHNGAVAWNTLLIGVVSTLTPFLLYTKGLETTEPGRASVMAFVEPMVATLISVFVLHEQMTLMGAVGVAAIFCSIVLLNCTKDA
ncbi:MAG: EamA family transporter [Clostridiales bacterium]|nr:EamA family transporter [Clostridiales bacterium]